MAICQLVSGGNPVGPLSQIFVTKTAGEVPSWVSSRGARDPDSLSDEPQPWECSHPSHRTGRLSASTSIVRKRLSGPWMWKALEKFEGHESRY